MVWARLALVLLASAMACGDARAAEVALFNGGFEEPCADPTEGLPGWLVEQDVDDAAGARWSVALSPEAAAGGRCLRLAEDSAQGSLRAESCLYPAVPGETYRAHSLIYNEAGDGWLYLEFYADEGRRVAETHLGGAGAGSWAWVTVEGVCPAEARYVAALLYSSVGNQGASRFDEVRLEGPAGEGEVICWDVMEPEAPQGETIMDLGTRRELFVDDALLETMQGLTLRLHPPEKREIALAFDAPWEGDTSAYASVFRDGDRYRMYYRGSVETATTTIPLHDELTATAESTDGIHWTRPKVGLFEFQGSRDNSIVYMGRGAHNFAPFLDSNPACKPEERYKALGGLPLVAFASADGYAWHEMQADPVITDGAFDSLNTAFFDTLRGLYVCYLRDFRRGCRSIKVCTSKDFIHWTRPRWLQFGGTPAEQLYTNAVTPYYRAPQFYLGFPKRFMETRKVVADYGSPGVSDGVFMSSRDGLHFRRWTEAFVRPGLDEANWTDRNNMVAEGIVETGDGETTLYVSENYQHPTNRMRRAVLRPDGFVSLHAGGETGEVTTRPLRFGGTELELNLSTSAAGGVQVEIQDEQGQPVPGFTLADCPVIYCDRIAHVVSWKGGSDLSSLAGQMVRLRFVMKDADLYSMRFR